MRTLVMLLASTLITLSGCGSPSPIAVQCPPLPSVPAALMLPPANQDLLDRIETSSGAARSTRPD